MNTFVLATSKGSGNSIFMIIVLIVLFAFTYFTMIKPQKKQQQQRQEMMNQLKPGDSVEMVDGLRGKIDSINDADKTVVLDADGIYLTFSRLAVRNVLAPASVEDSSAKEINDTDENSEKSEEKESETKETEPTSENNNTSESEEKTTEE